jgi:oligosaccharyltransferase complex subunit alpha (ribophorin I)
LLSKSLINFFKVPAPRSASSDDPEARRLNVVLLNHDSAKGSLYRIDFKTDLTPGKTTSFEVELTLFNLLKPYPAEISQTERQYVLFKGNHYYYSLYVTKSQTTTVTLASDKVESYSQLKPTSKSDSTITYGPYENVKPFEQNEMQVHYENNSPFLVVTNLVRTIEVSHWGNIAVEETIDLYHYGALLKGPFSRFDYMRRIGGAASVKSFKTLLPPSAADVYYRDEIGNISTSNLRTPNKLSKAVEPLDFEIRPRFPLFGGWRTHYTIGYNLPIYQYLFNKGKKNCFFFILKKFEFIKNDEIIFADLRSFNAD